MHRGYLGALGAYRTTTTRSEATVYYGASTTSEARVVLPGGTPVSVERLPDRGDWYTVDHGFGFIQAADINEPAAKPAPAAIGTATKVFAGAIGLALLYLVVTK